MKNMPSSLAIRGVSPLTGPIRAPAEAGSDPWLRIVDAGLALTILVLPWCMGGRHPLGELVLVVLALVSSFAWIARQCLSAEKISWFRSPADAIFLAALALVALQLIPLPAAMFDLLSPKTRELLPLWTAGAQGAPRLGVWNQVSMTPGSTQAGLILLLAYGLLFFTAVQRTRRLEDVERVLRWVALSVTLMAGFGVVQYLTSNGKFLWMYKHPFRDTCNAVTGMYINKNHFAHLLALGIGPLLWCLERSLRQPQSELERVGRRGQAWSKWLSALALGIVLFSGLMSLSRGGAAMIGLAALVCGGALYAVGALSRKFVLCTVGIALLIGCSLAIHGQRAVADRLEDYTAGSFDALDRDGGRRKIWQADGEALRDYFVLGSGVGSHRDVYPKYMPETTETEFTHAENGYLQIALETGMPGLALLLAALGYVAAWCYQALRRARSPRLFACAAAVSASLVVSAVHSLIDFVWYIPSCMAVTLVLVACAFRLRQWSLPEERPPVWTAPRWLAWAACGGVATAGAWMVALPLGATAAAPHWDAYLEFALSADARAGRVEANADVVDHLRQVVAWIPGDARAHLRLAGICLRHFERLQAESPNAMPLNQIRDAALASRFASRGALDEWLSRAIGEHRRFLELALSHTHRALAGCPLEGEAYTYLAELCFLDGADGVPKPALVDQALRVRPYSGSVLLCAGSDAALTHDLPLALEYWRRAFQTGPEAQRQFVDLWATAQMPVAVILQAFHPDLAAVRILDAKYSQLGQAEQVQAILAYYAELGQTEAGRLSGADAAGIWLELHDVYRRLENPQEELNALRRALALEPNDFRIHHALGTLFCGRQQFDEAEQHLRWCVERRPNDEQLKVFLATAVKGRIDTARASASNDPASWR